MRDSAPAALAQNPADRVTKKYRFFPTRDIVSAMNSEGWAVIEARTAGSRKKNPVPVKYRRHILSFVEKKLLKKNLSEIPRVILANSHDGNSAALLRAGIWRFICSNGMETPDSLIQAIRIPHMAETIEHVLQAAQSMREHAELLGQHVAAFKARRLSHPEVIEFARQAINLRQEPDSATVIAIDDILKVKRNDDAGDSLWKVFNRTQEWLLKGEYPIYTWTGKDWSERSARPIRGIDQNSQINTGLWQLAEQFSLN